MSSIHRGIGLLATMWMVAWSSVGFAQQEANPDLRALPEHPKTPQVKIGGGGILWYYQPTHGWRKNDLQFYHLRLNADVDFRDGLALHLETRVRDSKLRPFYDGTAWVEEGYASYTYGAHALKLGKVYSKFGLFWDGSFWGNVQVYDGLKLAPDYGASLEGSFKLRKNFTLGYAAQFFLVDGRTNVSLPGRDIVSIPNSRRRNQIVLRVDPTLKFGEKGQLRLGLSGQRFRADVPGIALADRGVWRYGADVELEYEKLGVWGEILHQDGQSVTDYPVPGIPSEDGSPEIPGRASKDVDYVLAGAQYALWRFTARYNFSAAWYGGTGVREWMHVPALGFHLNDSLSLGLEYVHWLRSIGGEHEPYNRSLNALLFASF
ncbi:MAG: hypothetical protein QM784_27355 [Polyangiaceae bacterium]